MKGLGKRRAASAASAASNVATHVRRNIAEENDEKIVGLASAAVAGKRKVSFLRQRREFSSSLHSMTPQETQSSVQETTDPEHVGVVSTSASSSSTTQPQHSTVSQQQPQRQQPQQEQQYYKDHYVNEKDDKHSIERKEFIARNQAITNPWILLVLRIVAAMKILCLYLISLESVVGVTCTLLSTFLWYEWGKTMTYNSNNNELNTTTTTTDSNTSTITERSATNATTTSDGGMGMLPAILVQFTTTNMYNTTTIATNSNSISNWNGDMALVLVTFAVVSPITVSIRMAFTRRERALEHIGEIRAYFQHIYFMHCLWDWSKNGGRAASKVDFLQHCDIVLEHLIAMGDEQARFLSLPTMTRGWNRVTRAGRDEAARTVLAAYGLLESVTIQRFTRLTVMAERLKAAGLIPSEVSRGRAFERYMCARLEQLRLLKMYRTPQALWSFARIFTLILPPFYGPTFAQVAIDMDSLAIGLIYGGLTSLVLTALLESVQVLEDPFTATISLDGIDIGEEFHVLNYYQLTKIRKLFFPTAPEWPVRTPRALTGQRYDPEVHFHSTPEEREELIQADAIAYEVMMEEGRGIQSDHYDLSSRSGGSGGGVILTAGSMGSSDHLVDTGALTETERDEAAVDVSGEFVVPMTHLGGRQSTAGSVYSRPSVATGSVFSRPSLGRQKSSRSFYNTPIGRRASGWTTGQAIYTTADFNSSSSESEDSVEDDISNSGDDHKEEHSTMVDDIYKI